MSDKVIQWGEELAAAASSGDAETVRRRTDALVSAGCIDEAIPYWQRASSDAYAAYTLARYRKIRGDRADAERLYRAHAESDAGCAYGLAVLLQEDRDREAGEWFRRGAERGHLECKIEAAKLLAAEGKLTEAAAFLMAGAELGDVGVFRWVREFEALRSELDWVAQELAAATSAADNADAADTADEARRKLNELRPQLRNYPGLLAEFEEHYRWAAELGNVAALADHALALDECGEYEEARELLLRARELGYSGATYLLGLFEEQRGELAAAEHWYTEAANADHESAQWNLATLYLRQRRLDEAAHWYERVGLDDDDVPGKLAAIETMRGQDHSVRLASVASLPGVRARAESGDDRARFEYGAMMWGWAAGLSARHMIEWIRPAAEAGDVEAARTMAKMNEELGRPYLRDHWWRRTAELGEPAAGVEMGMLSEHHHDWQEAERWYERAAAHGNGLAQFFAGKLKAQRGAFAEAEPLLKRAYQEGAERDYLLEATGYYGLVLHGLGRSAEAAPLLRTAADRWKEVERRYRRDDLARRSRTPDFAAAAEAAASAAVQ
ncbi:sel1 repeat family protein [Nocardia sp. SYP-A9097]|uniref:sel1 repeat family protein n=1 Tax=Nocardia sp. SYP-A9097 TaxID=2663237 RepID=UPI00129C0B4B|nr:sel1 repeat family protein [Nocardia sp. SYP-A9097]MRH87341.1 sel1 repeat family protein [Nocardia sp. SYP-A9097]